MGGGFGGPKKPLGGGIKPKIGGGVASASSTTKTDEIGVKQLLELKIVSEEAMVE